MWGAHNPELRRPADIFRQGEHQPAAIAPPQFHAEPIRAGLREQSVGGLVNLQGRAWRAVHLEAGQIRLREDEHEQTVAAPCFLWQPWSGRTRMRANAGSVGTTLLLGDTILANTIGHRPEAADIRLMLSRTLQVSLNRVPQIRADISLSFNQILTEASRDTLGSSAIVEAHARIIIFLLWRVLAGDQGEFGAAHPNSRLLQQFRQLLEAHFRERWRVTHYASALGVSRDRLHDLCTRSLGKPPRILIQERLIYEARLLLERSTGTNDQIAASLGFGDAAQFSKAFKAATGLAPGRYRSISRAPDSAQPAASRSYADWP